MTIYNRRQILMASALALPAQAQTILQPAGKVQAVIDSDAYNEIDDQYAIAYGLLSPQNMEIEAIYAAPFFNSRSKSAGDGMEKSYGEILKLLDFLKRKPQGLAFRGSDRFLESGTKPVDSEAARDLIRRALQPRSGPLYVITLGCPANVSSAILLEPKIKSRIVVVWLGGTPHQWPSAREFNLQQDLHASRVLFDSGVPLVQIPGRNVSQHLTTTIPELERFLKGRSKLGDFLFEEFVEYYREHTRGKPQPYPWSKVIWDISAVAWVINPKWVPSLEVPAPRLSDEFTWLAAPGRHTMRVAIGVDRDAIFYDLFEKIAHS